MCFELEVGQQIASEVAGWHEGVLWWRSWDVLCGNTRQSMMEYVLPMPMSYDSFHWLTLVVDCGSLNEHSRCEGLQEVFYALLAAKIRWDSSQFWAGASCAFLFTLFCDIFNLSLYPSLLLPCPGSPHLIFSFSHTFLFSIGLLLVSCPRSIISRTSLVFHEYMHALFFSTSHFSLHGVCFKLRRSYFTLFPSHFFQKLNKKTAA